MSVCKIWIFTLKYLLKSSVKGNMTGNEEPALCSQIRDLEFMSQEVEGRVRTNTILVPFLIHLSTSDFVINFVVRLASQAPHECNISLVI